MSKSDPIIILQEKKKPQDPWTFIGRTEMLKDNPNPAFEEKITLVGESLWFEPEKWVSTKQHKKFMISSYRLGCEFGTAVTGFHFREQAIPSNFGVGC
jgi:hypothetical protein